MFRTAMTVGSFDPELDAAINGERQRQEDHIELIASENYASPRVLEAQEEERVGSAGLKTALASLDPRSRRIVEARWLREKNAATLHELAAEFKVSAERIRQIEAKALEKMKKVMQFGAGGAATPLAPPAPPARLRLAAR